MDKMHLVLRDHHEGTEQVIFSFEMYDGQGKDEPMEDLTSSIPHDIAPGQEYAAYYNDEVYAHWTGEVWREGDCYSEFCHHGKVQWRRITGKPVIQQVDYMSLGDDAVTRGHKLAVMQAFAIGMGLSWPTGQASGEMMLYGIPIPEDRVDEFYEKFTQLSPHVKLTDLSVAECPSEELADRLRQQHGLIVTTEED